MLPGCGLLDCLRRGEQRDKHDAGRTDPRVSAEPSGGSSSASSVGKSGRAMRLGWAEIDSVTGGFSSRVIGQGGFSTVYLASLTSSRLGAVKVQRSSERLHRVFRQELDVLLSLRHPHVVRLLGFCDEREEGVLVFEYAANGDLHERLHRSSSGQRRAVLPWARRMAVAFQVAMALEYLHESQDPAVIHGDIKASNVLLDGNMDVKLCDFGFAQVGFSDTVLPTAASRASARHVMGSPGYVDPHFLRSGVATKKSDVYSFGVLLLELVTGREAICADTGCRLTVTVAPVVGEGKVADVVDRRLGDAYDCEEAVTVAALALQCINANTGLRPSMTDVVRVLQEKTSALISAVGPKPASKMVS